MTNQKALARKSTLTNTEAQDNQFEARGFAVQKKSDTHTKKTDLNTLLLQAKSFGHSISKLAGQESSSASPQTNGLSIQPKLSIGEPGDRYEQEADRVASVVVQRINAPSSTGESVQREAMPEEEDELQMKPVADSIQRVEIDDEEELQMKSQVQRQEAIGGGEASTDLESSINSARGSGQAIADNIREPMEVAFGADFSGVKVHTDGQSDQLNRSIQARAFTTGQDVFFRQGEYNPGSRGGQELLAHELTHVVQQNKSGLIRRKSNYPGLISFPLNITSTLQRMEMIQCAQPASRSDALLLTSTGYVSLRPPKLTAGQRAGGFTFKNLGNPLPVSDALGNPITYKEYDVNAYNGKGRDAERVVLGSDNRVWYTGDHYNTFTEIT